MNVIEFIATLPYPAAAINSDTLAVEFVNANAVPLFGITGDNSTKIPVTEFIVPLTDQDDFAAKIREERIGNFKIDFNLKNPFIRHHLIEHGAPYYERFVLTTHHIDNLIMLFFRKMQNPLLNIFTSTFNDFILHFGKDGTISNILSNFTFDDPQKYNLRGKKLSSLIGEAGAHEIEKSEKDALSYIETFRKSKKTPWKEIAADDFDSLEEWLIESTFTESWKLDGRGGLIHTSPERLAYIHRKEMPDLNGLDFAISIDVKQEIISRFAVLFNAEKQTPWLFNGYSAGIRVIAKRPFIILKKNSLPISYSSIAQELASEFTFRVEKTGGCIDVFINGKCELSFNDPEPASNKYSAVGILSSGTNIFSNYLFFTRDSAFDTGRLYNPYRTTIPLLGDRVYEAHLQAYEEWSDGTPSIDRALMFKDVTDVAKLETDRDRLYQVNISLRKKNYYGFIGGSNALMSTFDTIEKIADTKATILITGPTGSGKTLLANAIHNRSNRQTEPYIHVDCSSIPKQLLESELFGHEKGSFTGATDKHIGKFERAEGGTLFLDEIGNLDLSAQAKLLVFMENHVINRLGGTAPISLNVRIILATSANLHEMVKKGTFREDLFYRLNVFTLKLPSLKDRPDDIPLLVTHFIEEINTNNKLSITGIEKMVLDTLVINNWPGNVRELYNTILNLAIIKKTGLIDSLPSSEEPFGKGKLPRNYVPNEVRLSRIMTLLQTQPYFSARDCEKIIPVSIKTIRRDLGKLVSEGKLTTRGRGPSVRYFPINNGG